MKIVLAAGGTIEDESALAFLKSWNYNKIIGIDKGLEFLYRNQLQPDLIVGDFDSLTDGILEHYQAHTPIRQFVPEKDATDMEIGVNAAVEMGADSIAILGGTGTRLDHVLGNIQTLMIPLEKGIEAFLIDSHNRIRLVREGRTFTREELCGEFISFFPLTTVVEGLTLEGFKYPLYKHTLTSNNSLGVSNEVIDNEVQVSFDKGLLIMIESGDGKIRMT